MKELIYRAYLLGRKDGFGRLKEKKPEEIFQLLNVL
jgi:hypothetical protein